MDEIAELAELAGDSEILNTEADALIENEQKMNTDINNLEGDGKAAAETDIIEESDKVAKESIKKTLGKDVLDLLDIDDDDLNAGDDAMKQIRELITNNDRSIPSQIISKITKLPTKLFDTLKEASHKTSTITRKAT